VRAARAIVEAGADAIELNTSCPHGSITFRGGDVEETIASTVAKVRRAVDLPLIAKISPMLTSPLALVARLQDVGADGVTIFNRMTGLDIDPDAEAPIMHGGYAGHGGPWAIQYRLRWISEISQKVDIDIAGSGGVASGVPAPPKAGSPSRLIPSRCSCESILGGRPYFAAAATPGKPAAAPAAADFEAARMD
jgi:dihydroorotate dehydrogenase (fumarate)